MQSRSGMKRDTEVMYASMRPWNQKLMKGCLGGGRLILHSKRSNKGVTIKFEQTESHAGR